MRCLSVALTASCKRRQKQRFFPIVCECLYASAESLQPVAAHCRGDHSTTSVISADTIRSFAQSEQKPPDARVRPSLYDGLPASRVRKINLRRERCLYCGSPVTKPMVFQ